MLSYNFTRGRSQAEILLSFLHTDQFIRSVRLKMCLVYLYKVELAADFSVPRVSFGWLREYQRLILSLRYVTGETLLRLAVAWFLC